MAFSLTVVNTLIDTLVETGGAPGIGSSIVEIFEGSNAVHELSGVFYVVVLTGSGDFQMYSSSDSGSTWATVGSTFTPTVNKGGMCSHVIGTKIYVSYSLGFPLNDQHLYLTYFDTSGNTWGSETSYALGNGTYSGLPIRVEGPYAAHIRLDGSVVFLVCCTLEAAVYAVVNDSGTWSGPFVLSGSVELYETSIVDATGVVYAFYGHGSPPAFAVNTLHTDNSTGLPNSSILYTGDITSWNDLGLELGFQVSGDFFMGVGKRTADYPTIWGRPAILFGNPSVSSTWTLGDEIDTDLAVADYSVYTCGLFLIGTTLVFYYRGISSDGSHYIDRVGNAPQGSHNTPADWTWTTIIDWAVPVGGPYTAYTGRGETGFSTDGTTLRAISTLTDGSSNAAAFYLLEASDTGGGGAQTILPSGIASAEALGTPGGITGGVDVAPDGIPSDEAFGTPGGSTGPRDISPSGITSKEGFGAPGVNGLPGTRYSVY